MRGRIAAVIGLLAAGVLIGAVPAAGTPPSAGEAGSGAGGGPGRGPVTNLPLPRFVSLKTDEGNARRGPSLTQRIDWVFRLPNMPLLVTAEFENWRRIEDSEGQGGWIHYSLLSGARTVMIESALADLRTRPDPEAPVTARAEAGVVARLGECRIDWCRITADGQKGWVRKADIWGVGADEIRQ
ncbi:MAG: SH3 domain-containing protein [Pseudomonadota bacterium]